MQVPAIHVLSGEAKNSTALAMSVALPMPPNGCIAFTTADLVWSSRVDLIKSVAMTVFMSGSAIETNLEGDRLTLTAGAYRIDMDTMGRAI